MMRRDIAVQSLSRSIENNDTFAVAKAQHVQSVMCFAPAERECIAPRLFWRQVKAVHGVIGAADRRVRSLAVIISVT